MMVVIDTHAHIIVPEITRAAAPEESWRPHVYQENGQQVVEYGGRQIRSTVHEFVEIEGILLAQEAAGVEHTLICPWVSLLRYEVEAQEGLRISRIQNEALAGLAQRYPKRISALGTVPLQDAELAGRELEALMKESGMFGIEVAASVNGVYLGDDSFRPFWAAAEETGALIFIHPTTRGFEARVFNEYYLWNSVGNPLETTVTTAHLIMAGVMERHPRLKVLLAHGGGAILNLRGRLEHAYSFQPQAQMRLKVNPCKSLQRFYFDTITHNVEVLQELVAFAGPDHVLVGSDYPFDMGVERPAEIVRKLGLEAGEEAKILYQNADRLLRKEANLWQS